MRKNWLKLIVSSLIAFAIIGATLNLAGCSADAVAATQGTLAGARDEVAASGGDTERVDTVAKAVDASVKEDGTIDTTSALLGGGPILALWALRETLRLKKARDADAASIKKETSGSGTFGQRPTG